MVTILDMVDISSGEQTENNLDDASICPLLRVDVRDSLIEGEQEDNGKGASAAAVQN